MDDISPESGEPPPKSQAAPVSSGEPISEEALVSQALEGHETALEQLLLRYYDRVLNYIKQRMPASIDGRVGPEDILQHTYLKAFRAIGSFEPRSGYSFFSWLKRIADNERIDQLRKASREPKVSATGQADSRDSYVDMLGQVAGDDPTATVLARRRELIGVLHVTLAGMKPEHREAIENYYLQGHSLEEVATKMEMTTGQVRGLLHRARGSLRDAINRLSRYV